MRMLCYAMLCYAYRSFPSATEPSDHVLIWADLELETDRTAAPAEDPGWRELPGVPPTTSA